MNLVHRDPLLEMERTSSSLSRIFGPPIESRRSAGIAGVPTMVFDWLPAVDLLETPEEFEIQAELPEVREEDVRLWIENGVLRLEGERRQERHEAGEKYHLAERSYGPFARTFTFPDDVDDTKMRSELKDGVLDVHIPKLEKPKSTSSRSRATRGDGAFCPVDGQP